MRGNGEAFQYQQVDYPLSGRGWSIDLVKDTSALGWSVQLTNGQGKEITPDAIKDPHEREVAQQSYLKALAHPHPRNS